ncbi:SGNH hydrolase-type esterase domain-containing protein [Podospora didyma]|uniref:SGNH hydrolase-type esterase domain-containing protein n=1 Tax=Podospora didyma TaxID=330526 RepID=A0AAE0NZZ8_9PEZI|nr:SGNH hydrolase-type esterase domain-containing protein [Podospora didyma]
MAAGASVTFGVGSTTGNSYRKDLRDMLVQAGHAVNFVGQHKNGNFADNEVEATSGFVMAQIAGAVRTAAPMFLPNLVLIEAGTNNCNNGGKVPDAGANVTAMVDSVFSLSPGATVVLATLLQNKIAAQDACRIDVNMQYVAMASRFEREGARFVLVDMRSPDAPTTADLNDTRHPNDRGYQKMAVVWNQGIQTALSKGLVSPPASNGIPLDNGGQSTATAAVQAAHGVMAAMAAGGGVLETPRVVLCLACILAGGIVIFGA